MKFILIILIPYLSFTQIKVNDFVIPDDALHFYGACVVNQTSWEVQKLILPKQKPAARLLISNLITIGAIFGKEYFDSHRCNVNKRTGFNKEDIYPGLLSIPEFDIGWIVVRDCKKRKREELDKEFFEFYNKG